MQRLIDIESSAEAALRAMSAIRSPDQRVTDAADALASALARPARAAERAVPHLSVRSVIQGTHRA
jgi:hypothetical protein